MRAIDDLFEELQFEMTKVVIFDTLLSTIICFFITEIVAVFFGIGIWLPLSITFVYFMVKLVRNFRATKLNTIEKKNPFIKDMLSTARDNIHRKNIMALALFDDVLIRARHLSSGSLLNTKKIVAKLCITFVLSIILIHAAALDTSAFEKYNPIDKITQSGWYDRLRQNIQGEVDDEDLYDDDSIYGDVQLAALGNERIEVSMNSEFGEIDLTKSKEVEDEDFLTSDFPGEVVAVAAESSGDKIPKESELAKQYNKKLRELNG